VKHADRAVSVELLVDGVLERDRIEGGSLRTATAAPQRQRGGQEDSRERRKRQRDHRRASAWAAPALGLPQCSRRV